MSDTEIEHELPRSPKQLARIRRRRARARFWAEYRKNRAGMVGLVILGAFIVTAFAAPFIYPVNPADPAAIIFAQGESMAPPSAGYPLGTTETGQSVLTVLVWGSRVSLAVGLAATVISMVLGSLIGIGSGHYRNWFGSLLERVTDWFLVIPFLPLAIVLASVAREISWLGNSIYTIMLVIGITSWPGTARLVRSQTITVEARPYLERARVIGGSNWHQMTRHVLPNVSPLILANTTLTVAIAILSETTLSFLGLGPQNSTSWGSMLDDAFASGAISQGAWWYIIPPGLCVVMVVLAFTLIGRSLEGVLSPQTRER
jgi:peptide/nickel transport system permease protein